MSEYIVNLSADWANKQGEKLTEIVRCKSCKYYEVVPEDSGDWCGYWTDRVYMDGDGFCAWGERKERIEQ